MLIIEDIHTKSHLCLIQLQEAWMRRVNFGKKDRAIVRQLIKLSRDFEAAVTNMVDEKTISWRLVQPLIRMSELLYKRNERFKEHEDQIRSVGLPLDRSSDEANRIQKELFNAVRFPLHFHFYDQKKYKPLLREEWGPIRRLPEGHNSMKALPRVTLEERFRRELSI